MRARTKLGTFMVAGLVATGGAVAAAGTAAATPTHRPHPHRPTHPIHPTHPAHRSHHGVGSARCTAHRVAYTAGGRLVSWSATETNGTWNGTITVTVKRANRHAASGRGQDVSYVLTDAHVRFGKGANPPAAGDLTKVLGAITKIRRSCTDQTGAGVITIRKVIVRLPKGHSTVAA